MNGNPSFPGNVSTLEATQRQIAAMTGRVGSTKILRVPALSAAIAAAASSVSPTVSAVVNMTVREDGVFTALYGQERTGTAAKFATTEVRMQLNGSEDLFSDGTTGTYVPFLALFGPNVNWFPLMRRVRQGQIWSFTFRNFDTAAVANPDLLIGFIADADVARMRA